MPEQPSSIQGHTAGRSINQWWEDSRAVVQPFSYLSAGWMPLDRSVCFASLSPSIQTNPAHVDVMPPNKTWTRKKSTNALDAGLPQIWPTESPWSYGQERHSAQLVKQGSWKALADRLISSPYSVTPSKCSWLQSEYTLADMTMIWSRPFMVVKQCLPAWSF